MEGCGGVGSAVRVGVGDGDGWGFGVGKEDGGFGKGRGAPRGCLAFGVAKGALCGVVGVGGETVLVFADDVGFGEVDEVKSAALAMVGAGALDRFVGEGEGLSGLKSGFGE